MSTEKYWGKLNNECFLIFWIRFFSIKIKNSFTGSFSKSGLSHYYNLASLLGLRAADDAKHPAHASHRQTGHGERGKRQEDLGTRTDPGCRKASWPDNCPSLATWPSSQRTSPRSLQGCIGAHYTPRHLGTSAASRAPCHHLSHPLRRWDQP